MQERNDRISLLSESPDATRQNHPLTLHLMEPAGEGQLQSGRLGMQKMMLSYCKLVGRGRRKNTHLWSNDAWIQHEFVMNGQPKYRCTDAAPCRNHYDGHQQTRGDGDRGAQCVVLACRLVVVDAFKMYLGCTPDIIKMNSPRCALRMFIPFTRILSAYSSPS